MKMLVFLKSCLENFSKGQIIIPLDSIKRAERDLNLIEIECLYFNVLQIVTLWNIVKDD